MANNITNTPPNPLEAPRETDLSRAFQQLLGSLIIFIRAERDLDDISYSQDPAYSAWMRDAELAQENLTTRLRVFHALPGAIHEDRPLRRMAYLIDSMLGNEEPSGARWLHWQMKAHFFKMFQAPGIGASALHRNAMLNTAYHLVTALAALPLFDLSSPDEHADTTSLDEGDMLPGSF